MTPSREARPLLETVGKTIVHAGGPGNGQAAKICNNMMLGIQMISVCEAFGLADRLGLDRQKLFEISSTASGQCWSLTTYCPMPRPGPDRPVEPRLRAGIYRGDDAERSQAFPDGRADGRGGDAARGRGTALYSLLNEGQAGIDFSRNN